VADVESRRLPACCPKLVEVPMLLLSAAAGSPGAVLLTALVILAVIYALAAYPLYRIAKATHDCGDDAAFAWIPILSLVLMCRIAGVSAWTILVLLLAVVPLVGWLVCLVYSLVLWVKIGQRFGRTGLAVVAWIVPVIGAWVFAFLITPEPAA
jgi:hypothetical protein